MFLKLLSIIFFASCVFLKLASNVNPQDLWYLSLLSPAAIIIIVFNILWIILLSIKKSKWVLLNLIGLALLVTVTKPDYVSSNRDKTDTLTLLAGNLSFFHNIGNFSKAYDDSTKNPVPLAIKSKLSSLNHDIYCYQEFYQDEYSDIFNTLQLYPDSLFDHHFVFIKSSKNVRKRGLIILSQHPIIDKGVVFMDENNFNGAIWADIRIKGKVIRVLNVHLQSMQLNASNGPSLSTLRNLAYGYKNGVIKHANQLDSLSHFINSSDYPIILAGDFNELPGSYLYNQLNLSLNCAYQNAGKINQLATLNKQPRIFRIDHQFYSSKIGAINYEIMQDFDQSNHFLHQGTYIF